MNWKTLSISVIAIIGATAWYFLSDDKLEPNNSISTPLPEVAAHVGSVDRDGPLPLPAGTKPPLVSAPDSLDNSDAAVQKALADLSPQLIQWLMPEAQIRKWVVLVDQIADGAFPQEYRPLNYLMSPFATRREGEKLMLDPSNYKRANLLIDVVTGISPARLTPYYRTWYPRQ